MDWNQKIITLSNRLTKKFRKVAYRHFSKFPFESRHLQHLVSLQNREELLKRMPQHAITAEIGVNAGDFSAQILAICDPQKLFLIDVWASKRYHEGLFDRVQRRFSKDIESQRVQIIRAFSFTAIQNFQDQFFDWVYLDTDHSYATTTKELNLLRPKMKPGGIIAGHDYIIGNWDSGYRYGVIEAVREFCLEYNWEMIFLTHELDISPSFAIRKIIS